MQESIKVSAVAQATTLPAGLLKLARPKQWIKNAYLFAALVFAGQLFTSALLTVLAGFLFFCLASSSVYVLNDIMDADADKLHPKKRHRPIAAGVVTRGTAWAYLCLLICLWVPGAWLLSPSFGLIVGSYFLLNVAYSVRLKHLFLLDVMVIAIGFVLRAVAGAVLIQVAVSPWLFVCTVLLSLFLGLGKRRSELTAVKDSQSHRQVLAFYTVELVDQFLSGLSGTTIMAYSLYTYNTGRQEMMVTIPFVVYGLFRYLYLVHRTDLAGSPEEALLTDRPLLTNVVLWAGAAAFILYR